MYFWPTGYKFGGFHHPLSFDSSLEQLIKKKERHKPGHPKGEIHREKSGKISNAKLSCPLPMESGHFSLLGSLICNSLHRVLLTREAHLNIGVQNFGGFHYIDMIDWIIGQEVELNLYHFPGGHTAIMWLKAQTL